MSDSTFYLRVHDDVATSSRVIGSYSFSELAGLLLPSFSSPHSRSTSSSSPADMLIQPILQFLPPSNAFSQGEATGISIMVKNARYNQGFSKAHCFSVPLLRPFGSSSDSLLDAEKTVCGLWATSLAAFLHCVASDADGEEGARSNSLDAQRRQQGQLQRFREFRDDPSLQGIYITISKSSGGSDVERDTLNDDGDNNGSGVVTIGIVTAATDEATAFGTSFKWFNIVNNRLCAIQQEDGRKGEEEEEHSDAEEQTCRFFKRKGATLLASSSLPLTTSSVPSRFRGKYTSTISPSPERPPCHTNHHDTDNMNKKVESFSAPTTDGGEGGGADEPAGISNSVSVATMTTTTNGSSLPMSTCSVSSISVCEDNGIMGRHRMNLRGMLLRNTAAKATIPSATTGTNHDHAEVRGEAGAVAASAHAHSSSPAQMSVSRSPIHNEDHDQKHQQRRDSQSQTPCQKTLQHRANDNSGPGSMGRGGRGGTSCYSTRVHYCDDNDAEEDDDESNALIYSRALFGGEPAAITTAAAQAVAATSACTNDFHSTTTPIAKVTSIPRRARSTSPSSSHKKKNTKGDDEENAPPLRVATPTFANKKAIMSSSSAAASPPPPPTKPKRIVGKNSSGSAVSLPPLYLRQMEPIPFGAAFLPPTLSIPARPVIAAAAMSATTPSSIATTQYNMHHSGPQHHHPKAHIYAAKEALKLKLYWEPSSERVTTRRPMAPLHVFIAGGGKQQHNTATTDFATRRSNSSSGGKSPVVTFNDALAARLYNAPQLKLVRPVASSFVVYHAQGGDHKKNAHNDNTNRRVVTRKCTIEPEKVVAAAGEVSAHPPLAQNATTTTLPPMLDAIYRNNPHPSATSPSSSSPSASSSWRAPNNTMSHYVVANVGVGREGEHVLSAIAEPTVDFEPFLPCLTAMLPAFLVVDE